MQYRACTIDGRFVGAADKHHPVAPWENKAEGATVPVPQGHVVVQHGCFCGRPSILTITVHPADLPKLLPNHSGFADFEVKPDLAADLERRLTAPKGWDKVEA